MFTFATGKIRRGWMKLKEKKKNYWEESRGELKDGSPSFSLSLVFKRWTKRVGEDRVRFPFKCLPWAANHDRQFSWRHREGKLREKGPEGSLRLVSNLVETPWAEESLRSWGFKLDAILLLFFWLHYFQLIALIPSFRLSVFWISVLPLLNGRAVNISNINS